MKKEKCNRKFPPIIKIITEWGLTYSLDNDLHYENSSSDFSHEKSSLSLDLSLLDQFLFSKDVCLYSKKKKIKYFSTITPKYVSFLNWNYASSDNNSE